MKLLLIQPPVEDFYETDIRLQPIGLAYLKAALNKWLPEIKVVIRDYHQGFGRKTIPVPPELTYLKEYYAYPDKSPFSSFYHYYHFGASYDQIARDAEIMAPDIVGISSLFSPYYREAVECARILKKTLGVPVLMGGSHVSAMPEEMLSQDSVDFIIRGEGERPLVKFLEAFQKQCGFESVPNLGWKQEGKMIFNPTEDNFPIDELPIPDLSDFTPSTYLFQKKPLTFVITSRSCPHRCTFCSVHNTFGFKYRRHSVKRVLAEIQRRYEEGYRVFDFEDDNLTFYKDEMKELCRELIRCFPDKDIQCVAMNGISYLSLDDEMLELMKEAGFTHLNIALVSSDLTVRETTKRPHTIKKYLEVIQKASRLGFEIVSYQILGLPNETLESMIQTLTFGAAQPVLLGASMFYMTPHSPIAKNFPEPTEEDVFKSRLSAMAWEGNGFCREDIYTLFLTTRIIDFLKSVDTARGSLLSFSMACDELHKKGPRAVSGLEILRRLFSEKILYADTGTGLQPLKRFNAMLFFRIWKNLTQITTQKGAVIQGPFTEQSFPSKNNLHKDQNCHSLIVHA